MAGELLVLAAWSCVGQEEKEDLHYVGSWARGGAQDLGQEDQTSTEHHFHIHFGRALVISFFCHRTPCWFIQPSVWCCVPLMILFVLFFGQVHCLSRLLSLSTNYVFSRKPGKRPQKPFWPKADIKLNNEKWQECNCESAANGNKQGLQTKATDEHWTLTLGNYCDKHTISTCGYAPLDRAPCRMPHARCLVTRNCSLPKCSYARSLALDWDWTFFNPWPSI